MCLLMDEACNFGPQPLQHEMGRVEKGQGGICTSAHLRSWRSSGIRHSKGLKVWSRLQNGWVQQYICRGPPLLVLINTLRT